jgi:hypothetical protein
VGVRLGLFSFFLARISRITLFYVWVLLGTELRIPESVRFKSIFLLFFYARNVRKFRMDGDL